MLKAVFLPCLLIFCCCLAVPAQKLAVLAPEGTPQSSEFSERLEILLSRKLQIVDRSLSAAAFAASVYENAFNLTLNESKNIGTAVGCNFYVIVRAKTLRRYSSEKKEHYESYAAVYGISARTGRLVFWKLVTRDAPKPRAAEDLLLNSADQLALELTSAIAASNLKELNESAPPALEELPEESSVAANDFRPPLPYRRLRPKYTETADLYGIEATVDILVDIDETGAILSTAISRWAGFGLDESVDRTVREMKWRPASRQGKPLSMRVLLRYNFKKIAKD